MTLKKAHLLVLTFIFSTTLGLMSVAFPVAAVEPVPKITGDITWSYKRVEKRQGSLGLVTSTQLVEGRSSASLIFKDNGWNDDGTSRYTGTSTIHSTIQSGNNVCTTDLTASADNVLWHEARDALISQGQSSNWQYGFNYPPNRNNTVNFNVHPGYGQGEKTTSYSGAPGAIPCGTGTTTTIAQVLPEISICGCNPSRGGFLGTVIGSWFPDSGGPTVNLNRTATFQNSEVQEQLTVTGTIAPATANAPPEVNAGAAVVGAAGEALPLGGSVTDDGLPNPPAKVTSNWSVVSQPAGATVTFADATQPATTATFSKSGDYVLELKASDSEKEATATVSATIKGQPTAGFSIVIHSGGRVEFDASASVPYVPNVPITQYEWKFDDGSPATLSNNATMEHTYRYLDPFTPIKPYQVSLVVTDQDGNKSDPVIHTVDVCSPDRAPITAQEYAGLVRCVEAALPTQSPREILSTMRQMYYGSQPWSRIKTAGWNKIIPCGQPVPDPRPALSSKLYGVLMQATSQNTVLEGDISHVFTGLEAMECPADKVVFDPLGNDLPGSYWTVVMPNYYIATWGGDVGSAAGQKAADDALGTTTNWSHYLGVTGTRAGSDDLNADVDGLVLGYSMAGQACSNPVVPPTLPVPLSQALSNYYPDPTAPFDPRPAYQNRLQCFADMVGVPLQGGKFNEHQMKGRLGHMLNEFALPYYFQVQDPVIAANDSQAPQRVRDYSSDAAALFGQWLNGEVF